jgi:hypothetical protein
MLSKQELTSKINSKLSLPLLGFESVINSQIEQRANKIYNYLFSRQDRLYKECDNCCEKPANKGYLGYVYDTPWDIEGEYKYFCSEECQDAYLHWPDYAYFICDVCEREICEQNPSNGYMTQYRMYNSDYEKICLRCYEEDVLLNGIDREKFETGSIPGMFFSGDNHELVDAGYIEEGVYGIDGLRDAKRLCDKALALIDKNNLVVVGYERLSIMGDQGTISLWYKPGKEK